MESFTMSVDRGYLGRPPGERDPQLHRSMDDLAFQKTKGLELVRLLRVIIFSIVNDRNRNPCTYKTNWLFSKLLFHPMFLLKKQNSTYRGDEIYLARAGIAVKRHLLFVLCFFFVSSMIFC